MAPPVSLELRECIDMNSTYPSRSFLATRFRHGLTRENANYYLYVPLLVTVTDVY